MMQTIGKCLIMFGILLVFIGGILFLFDRMNWEWKLPGDILIKRGNFTFYFPITTCILISVLVSLVFYLLSKK